ncbi:hypothetical protein PRIC1_011620 [Phytophthora ramorum]
MTSLLGKTGHSPPTYSTFDKSRPDAPSDGPEAASCGSRLLFSFAGPLMQLGAERQLTPDDLWELERANQTKTAFSAFSQHYETSTGSLVHAVARSYGGKLALCGAASLVSAACGLFAPLVLHHVIEAFAAPVTDLPGLSLWLGLFFTSRLVNALVSAHLAYYLDVLGLRLTAALKALLFQKTLRRNAAKAPPAETVDVSNLFTSDANSVSTVAHYINSAWILPVQIGGVVYMLYWVIGAAAFAGLAVIGASSLAGVLVGKVSVDAFRNMMQQRDGRMKAIKEVFGAIQVVKLNAWEDKFAARVAARRATELRALRSFLLSCSLEELVVWASPLLVSIVSLAVYSVGMGQPLTAAKVFTALALFNALRTPLQDLPSVIQSCLHAKVALDRISSYLAHADYRAANVRRTDPSQAEYVDVSVTNGSFGWKADAPVLTNVHFTAKKGDLVVVRGAVGAGKSSLCAALLGEAEKLSGGVFVRGRVAYYSQQPWIQNMTIRANILFGHEFDGNKYRKVLDACGLVPDLKQFPSGDATELGHKGVNLSGGQKARVSLARACYADADVFLLDSPLAAVDAVVQSEIFSKCICELLEDKTVILVTHSPEVIRSPAVNYLVTVGKGSILCERRDPELRRSAYSTRRALAGSPQPVETASDAVDEASKGRFVEEEVRREGRVTSEVFWVYFQALGGMKMCTLVLVSQLLWQGFQIGSDLWLSHWTTEGYGVGAEETKEKMLVYALLGGGGALMVLVRSVCVVFVGLGGARYLFTAMTDALMHAPMRFFDTNPIGRIVNRYSTDMGSIDFRMPLIYGGFLADFFVAVCQLATAAYMVNCLGLLVVPLVWLYVKVASFYLSSSSEVTRLQRVVSSPVLSLVSQCEEGVTVIRAFGPECSSRMTGEMLERIDKSNKAAYVRTVTEKWYIVRIQLIGCAVVVAIVSALVYLRSLLSPGLVGLAFTYALNVDEGLANIVRQWSYVELIMVSPERVLEYASLAPEGCSSALLVEPAAEWPAQGTIQFDRVVFSYTGGGEDPVLDSVSFSIKNNEKRLQEMISRDFANATVLTIAHRLATVLHSDRILVLSEGKVVEFDTPKKLVKDSGGVFYELAKEGGYLDKVECTAEDVAKHAEDGVLLPRGALLNYVTVRSSFDRHSTPYDLEERLEDW